MQLKSIFEKQVDRQIEGVIKADDNTCLKTEVQEYVLTNEIEKRLDDFLDAYTNYQNANGVWISGFFGSGKSHLLKMMALLLENKDLGELSVSKAFQDKCNENKLLAAKITKAIGIPSQSILFNIDQKADVINKKNVDAILSVFVKVFDEMCGYYGKQGYIAHFERQLDQDGLLDKFCAAFEKQGGMPWSTGRERVIRVGSNIDKAFQEVTGENVTGVMTRYKDDYKLSIEDFAEQVKKYIDRKGKDFRLNFFVDEVGQYIADNTKLMTNLQTIAESLATKCRGRAWIIVTAQEDMTSVIGELNKQQGNDFTKITARFACRMKLTSQDVSEVIQKRLLAKTKEGEKALQPIYEREVNNFRTLFDFTDGQKYRNFESEEHFFNCYPFIPYQFDLFQLAIRGLSSHNAFEGKHSSVGERSMLGVFQEVAMQIADEQVGQLATFDLMYRGISSALKSHLISIGSSEKNIDNPLAVRLLKSLLLVKYIKEFRATVSNLCILMIDRFDQDLKQLRVDVEEALNHLENQIYIQRNGDVYEYLTDEEKDIEQEIKNTDVESSEVANELHKIIFDKALKTKKLRYEPNKRDFSFTHKLDDKIYGRVQELTVHVISSFHEHCENIDTIKMSYMGNNELTVVLPADDRLIRDVTLFKQTTKYVGLHYTTTKKENVKRILTEKLTSNKERERQIAEHVIGLMGKSRMFVAGSEIESTKEDPGLRIHDGFEKLVEHTYTNLRMLRGMTFTDNQIESCLNEANDGLFGNDATTLSEPEREILSSISRSAQKGIRTSFKSLTEDFETRPFGWPLSAIQCILAKLIARGKVEARSDGELLENADLLNALKNTQRHANLILEPQIEFGSGRVRQLKEFYEQFFDTPPQASEGKALGTETAAAFQKLHTELSLLVADSHKYPFLHSLSAPIAEFARLGKKTYRDFLTGFTDKANDLLNLKEDLLDPIRHFISGPQAKIYEEAQEFIRQNANNFSYLESETHLQLVSLLEDENCYLGQGMVNVKTLLDSLRKEVAKVISETRTKAEATIVSRAEKLHAIGCYETLTAEQKEEIQQKIDQAVESIRNQSLIAVIKETAARFENTDYKNILSTITEWLEPKPEERPDKANRDIPPSPERTKIEYISCSSLNVNYEKPWLESEADVEEYLAQLKAIMVDVINNKKRIQL